MLHHINNTPELTQRLFGNTKSDSDLTLKIRINPSTQQQCNTTNQQQAAVSSINRTTSSNNNTNSLLHQHLRIDSHNNSSLSQQQQQHHHHHQQQHSSLLLHHSNNDGVNHSSSSTTTTNPTDNNNITTTNNLHHQFLLHIQNNPTIITTTTTAPVSSTNIQSTPVQQNSVQLKQDLNETTEIINDHPMSPSCNTNIGQQQSSSSSTRPPQRRRIRRKATSTLDDQAEHLTEMSVRGLDLFRYASINEGVYQCTECAKENVQKTFKNKYSFQRHAFLYHEGKHRKVFPCPVCGKEFSRPDKMKNHMKTTHECYVPQKDVNYNPLNYLITAAAAENIKQQIFPKVETTSSSAATAVLTTTTITTTTSSSNISTTNSNNNLTTINLNSNYNQNTGNNNPEQTKSKITQNILGEIEIKNEITIENSPSPSAGSRPLSPANVIIEPIVKEKSMVLVGSTSITPIKESEEIN